MSEEPNEQNHTREELSKDFESKFAKLYRQDCEKQKEIKLYTYVVHMSMAACGRAGGERLRSRMTAAPVL